MTPENLKEEILKELIKMVNDENYRENPQVIPVISQGNTQLVRMLKFSIDIALQKSKQKVLEIVNDRNPEYKRILEHRQTCETWKLWAMNLPARICLECFGGGLTKFTEQFRTRIEKEFE